MEGGRDGETDGSPFTFEAGHDTATMGLITGYQTPRAYVTRCNGKSHCDVFVAT